MSISRVFVGVIAGATLACALLHTVHAQPNSGAGSGSDAASASGSAVSDAGSGSATPDAGSGSASAGSGSAVVASPVTPPVVSPVQPVADSGGGGEVIEISDSAPAESASSVHLTLKDLQYRSRTQVSDVLRNVPGLVVSQHAGGGKSDQYFIRGFDADHGTDIAIFVDGVPANLTSHGHGQGYADTHWLIPELVDGVEVHKGPYSARFGDFYTAGAMEMKTLDHVEGPTIWISGGTPLAGPKKLDSFNRRLVGMASPSLRDNAEDKALIAMQIADTDGPFINPQGFRQGNLFAKWSGEVGKGRLFVETTWYEAAWHASGQVPESESSGDKRWGSLDPTEGGDTARESLVLGYQVNDDNHATWRAKAYAVGNRLRLYSNFTLFARDPVDGDEIEQTDGRLLYGIDAAYERLYQLGDVTALVTAGTQIRADNVETSLWHDKSRVRLTECFDLGPNPCNNTNNRIRDLGAYVEATIRPVPELRIIPGLRFDQYVWDVEDLDPDTRLDGDLTTGGSAQAAILLPKLSVLYSPVKQLDIFANAGAGYHSNDARAAVASHGDGALARALGYEVGLRARPIEHLSIAADFWYLHLNSEQVWSGDAGGTEPSDPTRRLGGDFEVAYNPTPWLQLDANVTVARATLVANAGNGNALALAPKLMGSGGATVIHGPAWASLRGRGIGDRPGNDDGSLTAEGYFIVDVLAGVKVQKLDVTLTINNALNAKWREAQFADESAIVPGGNTVEQMHFTPGIPLTATITAAYTF